MSIPMAFGIHELPSVQLVNPKNLTLNPDNERDYVPEAPENVSLRRSIRSEGVKNPLHIYDDGLVDDGNRRLFNVRLLMEEGVEITSVPVIVVPKPSSVVEAVLNRLNKNEAAQFSPLEQGRAFAKLRDAGLNNSQIAARSPFTSMHVGNMFLLHDASDEIRAFVRSGQISATLAVEIIRRYGEGMVRATVKFAESNGQRRATQRHLDMTTASTVRSNEALGLGGDTRFGSGLAGAVPASQVLNGSRPIGARDTHSMNFLILRILTHSELGMFHEYRRQGKERSKQRAVNFDWDVVDRVFPAAKDTDLIEMDLRYQTDQGPQEKRHWLKRQEKNWRLEGNCPPDQCYDFVDPGCLFAMEVRSGSSPAVGSWAVFSQDDELTRSILADGESSRLAGSAMIALHGEEGRRIRDLLSNARPDLFTACSTPPLPAPTITADRTSLPPSPRRLVRILASVGHTLPSAVADIVDNSISANATRVDITFGRPDEGHGRWMAIADNGDGMSADRLSEAMRIGSEADYEDNSLGKFGYGLKGASWSQTDVFTVFSKTRGSQLRWLTWDTNAMDDWKPKSDSLEPWEQQAAFLEDKGTVVLWKQMRVPRTMPAVRDLDPYTAEVIELERHLALVFHRFLEGTAGGRRRLTITINGRPVEPNNPVGHPLTKGYDPKEFDVPLAEGRGTSKVRAKAYLLPHEDELASYHRNETPGAAERAWLKIGLGKANDTQGLFIYRNDRLIKFGGWHDMWRTNDEKKKLARVVVDFGKALDEPFAINISKQIVHLPQYLQVELRQVAEAARQDSERKYRRPRAPLITSQGGITAIRDSRPQPSVAPTGQENLLPNPAQAPAAASEAGGAAPTSLPTAGNGLSGPSHGGASNGQAGLGERVTVLPVNTAKFVWKVTSNLLTGGKELQVSGADPDLSALLTHLSRDQVALAHLTEFLGRLDRHDVQKALLELDGG